MHQISNHIRWPIRFIGRLLTEVNEIQYVWYLDKGHVPKKVNNVNLV